MTQRSERWAAYVKKDQVMRNPGGFRDEIAAAEAYDEAARELFGEHARLNFPATASTPRWRERRDRGSRGQRGAPPGTGPPARVGRGG